MDAFESFMDSHTGTRHRWSFDSLFNFSHISPVVQTHLKRVYLTLCCTLIALAAGAFLHLLWNFDGLFTGIAAVGCACWLKYGPASNQEQTRVALLIAFGVLQGASIGALIHLVAKIDHSTLISAFLATALACSCFSAAAMLAERREYLYLGGFLSAASSMLLWLETNSLLFGGSASPLKFQLYFGLLVFVGYVILDTQGIIQEAHNEDDPDYVKHALYLLTDFVAIFFRILAIRLKASSEKKRKKKEGNLAISPGRWEL